MRSASLDISATSLERARKRHRFRNPAYDRRFGSFLRCGAALVALVGATSYLRSRSGTDRSSFRPTLALLSRDDDAQYAEEFNFTASLPRRKRPKSKAADPKKAKKASKSKKAPSRKAAAKGAARKSRDEDEACATGVLSAPGAVRACCAPHCGACDGACIDAACCAPSIKEVGLVCRGPFDSQCVWAENVKAHLASVAARGAPLPRGEATDYALDAASPLATVATLDGLDAVVAELPVSRRRAYVLHMDPTLYQLGDPGEGSYPLAVQLSYLPKRFVVHFGMRLRLRDNTVVLTLGGVATGTRIFCAYVTDGADVVELTPFTSVTDIVSHDDADVARAAAYYRALWDKPPIIKEIASLHFDAHRTFDRAGR